MDARRHNHRTAVDRHLYAVGSRDEPPSDLCADLIPYVGDADALWRLDAEPIPDEPFDWSAVAECDRQFVAEVLGLADRCCDHLLDVEFRTISRRILARVAARDPRPLRRSRSVARCAAALVWLAGRASLEFGPHGRRRNYVLWDWFGVNCAVERGWSLRKAAGLVPDGFPRYDNEVLLGDASLLHSRYRANLILRRDALAKIDRERRSWRLRPDGHTIECRASAARAVVAGKGVVADSSRTIILVGLGDEMDDAEFYALTVPDAHDLIAKVQRALAASATHEPR